MRGEREREGASERGAGGVWRGGGGRRTGVESDHLSRCQTRPPVTVSDVTTIHGVRHDHQSRCQTQTRPPVTTSDKRHSDVTTSHGVRRDHPACPTGVRRDHESGRGGHGHGPGRVPMAGQRSPPPAPGGLDALSSSFPIHPSLPFPLRPSPCSFTLPPSLSHLPPTRSFSLTHTRTRASRRFCHALVHSLAHFRSCAPPPNPLPPPRQVQLSPGEAVTLRLYTVDSDGSDGPARPAIPVLSIRLLACRPDPVLP